jgi:sulfite dehydrogenase
MRAQLLLCPITFLLAVASVVTASAAPLKIELPPETAVFKPVPGSEASMAQCLICHSAEYISMQPLLTRAAWKATVEKMQHKFGAPLPADQVDSIVDYIVKAYGAAPAPVKAPPAAPSK